MALISLDDEPIETPQGNLIDLDAPDVGIGENADKPVPDQPTGVMDEIGRAASHGAQVTLPKMVGEAAQFFGADKFGQEMVDKANARETKDNTESTYGKSLKSPYSVRGNVYEAVDNGMVSLAPGAAGAAVGAGVGAMFGGVGALPGALIGYGVGSIASLPMFYGSQAQSSYEKIKDAQLKSGATPEIAESNARKGAHAAGSIEAGGELLTDVIPFSKLFKPFAKPVSKAAGTLVKDIFFPTAKEAGKTILKTEAGEVVTEMGQQAGESAVEGYYGAGPGATWDATSRVIMPTAIMSLIPGMAGAASKYHQVDASRKALENPETPPEVRSKLALAATREMANVSEDTARGFSLYAGQQIAAGQPIQIEDDAFYAAQTKQPNNSHQTDPLATQLKAQTDQGNSPLSRAAVAAIPELKVPDAITQAGQQWQTIAPDQTDELARQQRIAEATQGATFDGLPAGESEALPDPVSPEFIDGMPSGTVNAYAPGDSTGAGLPATDAAAGLGAGPGAVDRPESDPLRAPADDLVPAAELPIDSAAPAVAPIAGDQINKTWTEFHPASGTLNIPRKEMPQIKSEHRGAMTNFLAARGITATPETVDAESLKPTQREFSPAKVKQAMDFKGSDRPILVSSDGHILDGHHQWLAKANQDAPVKITRLNAPIADLLTAMKDFPSAGMAKDAEPFSQPQGKTDGAQTAQAQQTEEKGQEAPAAKLKLVLPPQNIVVEPASPKNPGNEMVRRRRAQVQRMANSGFTQLVNQDGKTLMVNPQRNEAMALDGGSVHVTMAQQAIAALQKAPDNVALGQTNGQQNIKATSAGGGGQLGQGQGSNGGALGPKRNQEPLQGNQPGQLPTGNSVGNATGSQGEEFVDTSLASQGRALEDTARDTADVATTALRAGSPTFSVAPAGDARTQDLNKYLNVFGGFLGRRGIAISDTSSSAADGLNDPATGRYYANIDNAQMAPSRTVVHEASHNMEELPEVLATYHKMWNLVPDAVKKAYFEGYMERGTSFDATRTNAALGSSAAQKLMDKLMREMMADFMSGNFHDRLWLEALAKKKPYLFQKFIEEWIPLLGNMLELVTDAVKKLEAKRGNHSPLRLKDIDALMVLHGAQKELASMKEWAMDVAVTWAQNNPNLAQKSGLIETAADVQSSRRVGPHHNDLTDDYLVPESAIWQDSTSGNLIKLPPLAFKGLGRNYPSAPVRIRIGRHGNEMNTLTGRPYGQYGLQHRVSNETETSVKKYRVDGDKTNGEQWADLAARDLMTGLLSARSMYAQQDAAKLGLWAPDPGGQAGLWTILQYATDKKTGEKFWDVQTVTPRSAKWVSENHRNNAPLPMSGFTFDGLDAQTSSGLAVRTLNELRAPTPIPPSTETVSIDDQGQVVNPRMNPAVVPVAIKQTKLLARDANGKIILNKNKLGNTAPSTQDKIRASLTEKVNEAIQQSVRDQTDTPEFKRWFSDSKVADKAGRPLVVYHGTGHDFSEFDFGEGLTGAWFTASPDDASSYAKQQGSGGNVMPVYLSIKRPITQKALFDRAEKEGIDWLHDETFFQWARKHYDGFIENKNGMATQYIPFSPTQIKSAIGNNGNFDPANPDIRKSQRVALQDDLAEQEQWLERESKARGYEDVEDLFTRNGDLFNELARLWREQRPVDVMYSIRPDMQAELQAELDAEMSGTNSLMAENNFPELHWEKVKGDVITTVPDLYGNGKNVTVVLEHNDGKYGGQLADTWIGASGSEATGDMTLKGAKAFMQRFVASKALRESNFDLTQTLDDAAQQTLLTAWAGYNQDEARRYPRADKAFNAMDIARAFGLDKTYDIRVYDEPTLGGGKQVTVSFKHKVSGALDDASIKLSRVDGKWLGTINTEGLQRNGLGSAFYQMMVEYAKAHQITIHPDHAISGVNTYRRTEQMLSATFRTGDSTVMLPHPTQRIYGFDATAQTPQAHDANIVRMLLAGLRNVAEVAPEADKLVYHPETGVFTNAKGKDQEAAVQKLLAKTDARAMGLGRATLARAVLTRMALDGQVATAVFKEPILYSARDTAAAEYQAVVDQYQNTDAWMKAPNGQPTNLTERQWVQVRTPSFASWFGPWQEYGFNTPNGTVWNDSEGKVSKAIDDNGEPLVVYHGTDKGGFMAFTQPGGERRGDLGIFTTPNRDMASSYVRKGREKDLTPPTDAESFAELGMLVEDYEGRTSRKDTEDRTLYRYETPYGEEAGPFETESDAMRDALDKYGYMGFEPKSGIYAVFVNIRNPNEEDFEGALWSGSREHLWQVVDADGETLASGGKIYMEEDEARALAKSIAAPDDEYEGADFLQPANDHWNDTDGVVRGAISMKNDGAIIHSVVDDGGGRSKYNNEPSDVFVALKPGQLKSADFNTGEFGLSRDLRYSKRDTSDINPKVLEAVPEVAKLAAYLAPAEKAKLRVDTAQKMVDLYKALPSADEMAAVAYAGKAKRFWYRNSLSAIAHVFGADGWRFTGLLAAMSPQCSVEANLFNALNTWKNWVAAGRPTGKAEIVAVMGRSVQGNKGEDSVFPAWINNAVSALSAKDFADLVLSGPKVDSFMHNLLGHYYEVANDAWMANYALMDQKIFSGRKNKDEPGKGPGYLAMNAQVRKTAKKLGWQPAEVQETVWSWAMSMFETMDKQGETRGSRELLADGIMTDELINRTPDFRSLFHLPVYADILEQAGYHDALAGLVAPHTVEDHGSLPFEQKKMDKLLHQAGLRLEFLQRQRRTHVQLSWEARPGESTGVLPGIHAASIELQQQYLADIYSAIESSGFYDKTGLSLRATLFGPGAWQGKVLPGAQSLTRPGIVPDNKGGLMVDPESRAKINVAASVLGIVPNQEGVYWHYPIYRNGNEALDNGVEINFGRSLTNDEMAQLYGAIIKKAGHTDWAPANTPTGVRVLNFSDTANKKFHKVIQSALKQFERKFDGNATAVTFSSDGDALENNWKENTDGQDYLARISQAGRSDLHGWINDVLQPAIDQINRRYSAEHGWGNPTHGDIQRSARGDRPSNRRRPGDAATIRSAIHFGQHAGLNQLSGLSNGTGIRGAEDQRVKEATDPRIKRRVYFYSPVQGDIPQPEVGLGGNVYQADLENIYDPSTANQPLNGSGNAFESAVLDAGYDGYTDPVTGTVVLLDRDVPVKQIGKISDFKLIQRVAKQVKLKTQTTVSGDELVRKPEPAELMALIKNKDTLSKAAPSFRMEYGFARVNQTQVVDFDKAMAALGSSFRFAENTVPIATPSALPNSKIEVNKTLAQRADTMRKLIACLA